MLTGISSLASQATTIVYQSTSAPRTQPAPQGQAVLDEQYVGVQFATNGPAVVTSLAVDLGAGFQGGTLFGALIQLAGPNALPSNVPGDPFGNSTVLATALFDVGVPSELRVPLLATLDYPGDYAVVVGAGMFGSPANADGFAVNHGPIPECCRELLLWWDKSGASSPANATWTRVLVDSPVPQLRNVPKVIVEGRVVPELSSVAFFASGLSFLLLMAVLRKRSQS